MYCSIVIDYAGINKEKSDFWQTASQDGTLETLKAMATNEYVFAVNEAVNNKMMHYAGVITKATALMGQRDGLVFGEMWIPVVRK